MKSILNYMNANIIKLIKKNVDTINKTGDTSLNLPRANFTTMKKMKPAAIPYEIEYEKAIKTEVKNAGMATSKFSQEIFLNSPIIIIPTRINNGDVAADGTTPTNGAKITIKPKPIAVTTLAKPVRAPAAIPVADSMNVVVFDVPTTPAKAVVKVSTTKARSIFELKPSSCSNAFVSTFEKIPV